MNSTDPVCGMPVSEGGGIAVRYGSQTVVFCSEFCRRQFERRPTAYGHEPADHRLTWAPPARRVAYFSMEVGLSAGIPTYAGGLGVLAGDTIRSCADLEVPLVAVSLVHRHGYGRQHIVGGSPVDSEAPWAPEDILQPETAKVVVHIDGSPVWIRAWQMDVVGSSGYRVPVLLLDSDVPQNGTWARTLTHRLYGGDEWYRVCQQVILGVGGVRMLRAAGYSGIETWHLNEGHAAFAPLELLLDRHQSTDWEFPAVRAQCVFTTHTPVRAGHDRFDYALVRRALGDAYPIDLLRMLGGGDQFNMTSAALALSHYVNGVALRHREVSTGMFPGYEIHQITNGVHSPTWTSPPFRRLFDQFIPGWRGDPAMLRNAVALGADVVWAAHVEAKRNLLDRIATRTGHRLREESFTIGFARRATAYKRAPLALSNTGWLRDIGRKWPIQFVFSGKAHPADAEGQAAIREICRIGQELSPAIPILYVEDYDMDLALAMVSGVDLWLNTPRPPLEASGTSGMKAAHNGVPSLSTIDGWWLEGLIEGATGWGIGPPPAGTSPEESDAADATSVYRKLETVILPVFFSDPEGWRRVMRQTIAVNASFFNSHRMVRQYVEHAYALDLVEHGGDLRL